MHPESAQRRIYIAGNAIDIWRTRARFSWTPAAIEGYMHPSGESLFNALVLLGDSDPKGAA
jgi:hypothetical protein